MDKDVLIWLVIAGGVFYYINQSAKAETPNNKMIQETQYGNMTSWPDGEWMRSPDYNPNAKTVYA